MRASQHVLWFGFLLLGLWARALQLLASHKGGFRTGASLRLARKLSVGRR